MGNCTDTSDTAGPKQTQDPNSIPQTQNTTTIKPSTNTQPTNNGISNGTTTAKPDNNTTTTTGFKGDPRCEIQLKKHNQYRQKHHTENLILSEWLCKGAQKWAQHLAQNNKFEHSQGPIDGKDVGQNIYMTSTQVKGGQATKAWYDQVKFYKYGNGEGTFNQTGHFSQVVWKGSKQVGFGFSGGIVVGNYYPAGNMLGSWEKNVIKPT